MGFSSIRFKDKVLGSHLSVMLMRYLALMHYVVSQTDRQMDSQTSDTTIPKAAAGPQTKGGHLL